MDDKTEAIITNDAVMEQAALKKPQVSFLASEMGFKRIITSEAFLKALTEKTN